MRFISETCHLAALGRIRAVAQRHLAFLAPSVKRIRENSVKSLVDRAVSLALTTADHSGDDDAVARLEILDARADFRDNAHALVAGDVAFAHQSA